jgi:hypothetical protein
MVSAEDNQLVVEIDVSGELIDWAAMSHIKSVSGNVKITGLENGLVDITINLMSSSADSLTAKSSSVPVIWEGILLPDGRKVVNDINIDDYKNGLFVSISILRNGDGWLHLATSTTTMQCDVVGYIKKPLFFKPVDERVALASDISAEGVELAPDVIVKPAPIRVNSEIIYVFPVSEEIPTTRTTITSLSGVQPLRIIRPTFYGLVHEVFFDAQNVVPEQVPGWWRDGTWIDYGVYVEAPSEARIKSDLRYYNRYYHFDELASKELWTYEIDTHGADVDEPDKPLLGADYSWLYPSEVVQLWYYCDEYEIMPHGTIVLADACRSLWDSDETSGGEMAEAWVNYGANAFVGSTILVPIVMDAFTQEFWQSLCYQEETVGKAEADASIARGLNPNDFLVYGDSNSILP